jgi:3-keto-disaccharide hydrolase
MLSGIALVRRVADHLVAPKAPPPLEAGFQWLFDGTLPSFQQWIQAGPGSFQFVDGDGVITAHPGNDIGLLFFPQEFSDFTLRLQFRIDARVDNSGCSSASETRGSRCLARSTRRSRRTQPEGLT